MSLTALQAGDHLIELVGHRRVHLANPAGPFPFSAFSLQPSAFPPARPSSKTAASGLLGGSDSIYRSFSIRTTRPSGLVAV